MPKDRSKKIILWGSALAPVIILSLISGGTAGNLMSYIRMDWLMHFLSYALMSMMILPTVKKVDIVALLLILMAGLIEVVQGFVIDNRTGSWQDWAFSAGGVIIVYVTGEILVRLVTHTKKNKNKNTKTTNDSQNEQGVSVEPE